jgi:hypothetical protein
MSAVIDDMDIEKPQRGLERGQRKFQRSGDVDDRLLPHLSPLGWEHINLTGDYFGLRANRSIKASSDRFGWQARLSVRFFPFRELTRLS